jgi:hypothetical protein
MKRGTLNYIDEFRRVAVNKAFDILDVRAVFRATLSPFLTKESAAEILHKVDLCRAQGFISEAVVLGPGRHPAGDWNGFKNSKPDPWKNKTLADIFPGISAARAREVASDLKQKGFTFKGQRITSYKHQAGV